MMRTRTFKHVLTYSTIICTHHDPELMATMTIQTHTTHIHNVCKCKDDSSRGGAEILLKTAG